jgi:hypothetical protein
MENIQNFSHWLNESTGGHDWEMIKVPTDEKFLKDAAKMYQEMFEMFPEDEPGSLWDIYFSTAYDERPYPRKRYEDEDGDEDDEPRPDVKPFAERIRASSALDALVKYTLIEYADDFWLPDYSVTGNESWKEGVPDDCEDSSFCDWNYDDGKAEYERTEWHTICIKKVEGINLSSKELADWLELPYHLKQKFATEKISLKEFFHKYRGPIASRKFGL